MLSSCGSGAQAPRPPETAPGAFAAVDKAMRNAFQAQQISGMGLAIYDPNGARLFERMYGDFSSDRRIPVASASKLVSGVVLFRLIDAGSLSLDSTTGEVLHWTGPQGSITLRHLLSFTSGLRPQVRCTYRIRTTLAECVEAISRTKLRAPPGARFDYGSTHLHVAGRMAEVVTGKPWNQIFAEQLVRPLGLPGDLKYFGAVKAPLASHNPLIASGLQISMRDYERILRLVFDKGRWRNTVLIAPKLFDAQASAPYPDAVIGTIPADYVDPDTRYGLAAWLECDSPATGCAVISSPGAFGFSPWLDRDAGYYAILGMNLPHREVIKFVKDLREQLKPLIVEALSR
jgi:CubicO group peptidase (beta-lactamase class C family)